MISPYTQIRLLLVGHTNQDEQHYKTLQDTGFWGKQGAGCIILARDTGRILLPLRSRRVQQPSTWGTWGGAVDEDESPIDTVRRELQEEVGFDGNPTLIPLLVFQSGEFKYYNFLAIVDHEFRARLNWETAKAGWFAFGEWPKPLHFGLKHLLSDQQSIHTIQKMVRV